MSLVYPNDLDVWRSSAAVQPCKALLSRVVTIIRHSADDQQLSSIVGIATLPSMAAGVHAGFNSPALCAGASSGLFAACARISLVMFGRMLLLLWSPV